MKKEIVSFDRCMPLHHAGHGEKPYRAALVYFGDVEESRNYDTMILNPKYTFDRYVVGRGNRFAHAVSMAVAEAPGEVYNPLLLYGAPGLGKTHLLHAAGHLIHKTNPQLKIHYITCEQFINDYIRAINQKKTHIFRKQFQSVDVLMIENIEFLVGKMATQEEFFNIFNELYGKEKQIIITSSKPPQDLAGVDQLLCTRFDRGLAAAIRRSDHQTRIRFLQKNAEERNLEIPNEAIQLVAASLNGDFRQLEGYLSRLEIYVSMTHEPITPQMCLRIADDNKSNKGRANNE